MIFLLELSCWVECNFFLIAFMVENVICDFILHCKCSFNLFTFNVEEFIANMDVEAFMWH